MPQHEKWLAKAKDDLAFATVGLRNGFFAQVCFLSQQVVEKCLKGFLSAKGRLYPRTHKVVELARLCSEIQKELTPLKNDLKLLDEFYIPTRYPDAIPGSLQSGLPSEHDAQEALKTAETVFNLIQNTINLTP